MKRRLIIIIISFIVILGVSIGGFSLVQRSPKLQNSVAKLANVKITNVTNAPKNTNKPIVTNTKELNEVKSVSRIFAERYGSTSNQDPLALKSVLPYSSTRLVGILQANLNEIASKTPPSIPVTVETKAYVVTVTDLKSTSANATISTIRQETVGTSAPKATQQELLLDLVRENGAWRVDQVRWGDISFYGN